MPNANNNKRPVWLGLTGGMGSGKSTALAMFRKMGAHVMDADAIVHDLLASDASVKKAIRRRFGPDVFAAKGAIDRKALAARVFRNSASRIFLERLLHPRVRRRMVVEGGKAKARLIVGDVPLLFEKGWKHPFHWTLVVDAGLERRLQRLKKRGVSRADALRRMKVQWPMRKKIRRADFVIDNNGSMKRTRTQIQHVWNQLTRNG